MTDIILNIAKGRIAHYASLPGTNDALIAVPLEASGLVADSTMVDYDTLAAILAGASNEQTTVGRVTLTNVTVTVNDTDDRVDIDADPIAYAAPTASAAVGAFVICYDPDTTAGTDADLIPLGKYGVTWTPDGNAISFAVADFARAS